jgi:isopentenyl phosphate kinase
MLTFLKLGGSLITDKSRPETPDSAAIERLAAEIARALVEHPGLSLIVGHGSGSYGHSEAAKYGTHRGVEGQAAWRGFARVALSASRLNFLLWEALDDAGIPAFRVQPSASAICQSGKLVEMALGPLRRTLDEGLVPLVYGDVAVDTMQGGTIISTEAIFGYLARALRPDRIVLAGDFEGVFDQNGSLIERITPKTYPDVRPALGGSAHTDVTGGMRSKVEAMLALARAIPGLEIILFSGAQQDNVYQALMPGHLPFGTHLSAD